MDNFEKPQVVKTIKYSLHNGKSMDHGFYYFTQEEWDNIISKIKDNKKFLADLTYNEESNQLLLDFLKGKREEDMVLLYKREKYLRSLKLVMSFI